MKFVYALVDHTFTGRPVKAKEFLFGGHVTDVTFDPATQAVAILDVLPDFRTDRCDDSNPLDVDREVYKRMAIRPATQQELSDYDDAKKGLTADLVLAQAAFQALGAELLDKLDQAITVLNQCRTEATHTQRAPIPPIDRQRFWNDVKARYKGLLP